VTDTRPIWRLNDGRTMRLITPAELTTLPVGTVLVDIFGQEAIKGGTRRQDVIDGDTRGGYLAYGILDAASALAKEQP
jgi:hypothetical protein